VVFFAADELPPSAERVLEILAVHGPLTHKDLVAATRLPARTLRFALARLRASGRVAWRWSLRDARQRLYFLAERADPSCSYPPPAISRPSG
jgi:predicted ArsR family transcriptional regulator